MSLRDIVTGTFSLALRFSWVGLIIAALPSFGAGLILRAKDAVEEDTGEHSVPWVSLGLVGGLMGEMTAVASLTFGVWWLCLKGDQECHDGQAGMVLILTIPALSLLGSIIALLWTWVSLRIPADKIWASVFRYSGSNRFLNWTCAVLIQLIF